MTSETRSTDPVVQLHIDEHTLHMYRKAATLHPDICPPLEKLLEAVMVVRINRALVASSAIVNAIDSIMDQLAEEKESAP